VPQRSRGAQGREGQRRKEVVEVFVVAEAEHFHIGSVAMKVADRVDCHSVEEFAEQISEPGQYYCTTPGRHLDVALHGHNFERRNQPLNLCRITTVVHRVISLLKHFLMGTYYGVSTKHWRAIFTNSALDSFDVKKKQHARKSSQSLPFTVPMTYAELKS